MSIFDLLVKGVSLPSFTYTQTSHKQSLTLSKWHESTPSEAIEVTVRRIIGRRALMRESWVCERDNGRNENGHQVKSMQKKHKRHLSILNSLNKTGTPSEAIIWRRAMLELNKIWMQGRKIWTVEWWSQTQTANQSSVRDLLICFRQGSKRTIKKSQGERYWDA